MRNESMVQLPQLSKGRFALLLISFITLTQTDLKTGTVCKLQRDENAESRKGKKKNKPMPRLPKRLRRAARHAWSDAVPKAVREACDAGSDAVLEAARETSPPPITYPFSTAERKELLFIAQQEDLNDTDADLEAATHHLLELMEKADEESQQRATARARTNVQPPRAHGGWMVTYPWSKAETQRLLAYNYDRDLMQVTVMLSNAWAAIDMLTP